MAILPEINKLGKNMSDLNEMHTLAKHVQANSYSPYSKFRVGCCIKTTDGHLFTGCNVENASYSLTLCAESSAIAQMIANGEKEIAEIVIIGQDDTLCMPCGACRQRLYEFAQPETKVHLANSKQIMQTITLAELLPYAFSAKHLSNLE